MVARREIETGRVELHLVRGLEALGEVTRGAVTTLLDVPIGLLDEAEGGGRPCDRQARQDLGRRGSSVFAPPVRGCLGAATYAEALLANRASSALGLGISIQCYNILPRISAVDKWMTPARQRRVREGHPELSFVAMNGSTPLAHDKKSREGRASRVPLLETALGCTNVEEMIAIHRKATVVEADDILDALALCWSASRLAASQATVLGDGRRDSRGLRMEICV